MSAASPAVLPMDVIGASRHAEWLARESRYIQGFEIRRWAPSPDGSDLAEAAAMARIAKVDFIADWQPLAEAVPDGVLLVLSDAASRMQALERALCGGRTVLCPSPAAFDAPGLNALRAAAAQGDGALLGGGDIAYSEAGARALRLLGEGDLGRLHSVYLAIRMPRGSPSAAVDVLARAGWQAFDFVLACVPGRLLRIQAVGGTLFHLGAAPDTVVCIARFEPDIIATIEIAQCLPTSLPVGPRGEIEVELIGSHKTLLVQPQNTAARLYTDDRVASEPWLDDPLKAMLHELLPMVGTAPSVGRGFAHQERLVALMEAARGSLASTMQSNRVDGLKESIE